MSIPPAQHSLDIVTVAIMAASAVVGSNWGGIVGPYAVILLAAIGGATWSAAGRDEGPRWHAVRHVALLVGLSLLATVPLAELLTYITGLQSRWMLGPVAALIAARPEWVMAQIKRFYDSRVAKRDQEEGLK